MKDIIIMCINGKEAKLVLVDDGTLRIMYDNKCVEIDVKCKVDDVLEEPWIGEALIEFAVHNYIFQVKHKAEFEMLTKLLD